MIMDRAEICLLLPNRPLSFGDKVGQLRRRASTPRCLFGPPDPAETQRLLQEQMQRERDRFQRRWNIDLDAIEAELETKKNIPVAKVQDLELGEKSVEDARIPPLPTEVVERLSSTALQKEEKTLRSSSAYVPNTKKPAGCKKPCSKFQKRIRVAGHKRQTYLTEFWRSRRSISFAFGKSKPRPVTLPESSSSNTAPVPE